MKYNIISVLLAWIFPTKKDRQKFRNFCQSIDNRTKIVSAQKNYPRIIANIRKNKENKIKVLFLVNEISKWKTQSLYDLMNKSEKFEPVIAVTIADVQRKFSKEEKSAHIKTLLKHFSELNMTCINAWNCEKNKAINLKTFKPQIVFYQQPWYLSKIQQPQVVSRFALTCYVPYFVPNYGIMNMDCSDFHKFLFRNYVLNNEWEKLYKDYVGDDYGDNIFGVGHTMLDEIYLNKIPEIKEEDKFVIYAPHWSIPYKGNENDENYSTFLWNYKLILNYAQNHPEFKWVFKPHPTLKSALKRTGLFTDNDIENYYKEWEKIATPCYSSDYTEIFLKSKALITDCGSFLIEYFCTGKPVIHLISQDCKAIAPVPTQRIFNTFYQVRNPGEFYNNIDTLLQKNNDYKKEERLNLLKELNLENNYAAKNILTDLETVIYN